MHVSEICVSSFCLLLTIDKLTETTGSIHGAQLVAPNYNGTTTITCKRCPEYSMLLPWTRSASTHLSRSGASMMRRYSIDPCRHIYPITLSQHLDFLTRSRRFMSQTQQQQQHSEVINFAYGNVEIYRRIAITSQWKRVGASGRLVPCRFLFERNNHAGKLMRCELGSVEVPAPFDHAQLNQLREAGGLHCRPGLIICGKQPRTFFAFIRTSSCFSGSAAVPYR